MIGCNEYECWSVICEVGIMAPFVCALYHLIRCIPTLLKLGLHLYSTIIVNQWEDISALLALNEICFFCINSQTGKLLLSRWCYCHCKLARKKISTLKSGTGPCTLLKYCDITGAGKSKLLSKYQWGLKESFMESTSASYSLCLCQKQLQLILVEI